MPLGSQLVGVAYPEKQVFLEVWTHELHPDRQSLRIETDREGQPRYTRQVGGQGEDIFQVHCQGIIGMVAELEGGGRRNWGGDYIHLFEGLFKIALDQCPHLLGFTVICVVVTGREGVSPQHDPAFDLGPELLAAGLREHLPQVFAFAKTRAEADAIVTRQVGGGFSRSDQVIDRQSIFRVRQLDRENRCAKRFHLGNGCPDILLHCRLDAFNEVFLRDTDP